MTKSDNSDHHDDTTERADQIISEAEGILKHHPNATMTDLVARLPEAVLPVDEGNENPRAEYSATQMVRLALLRELCDQPTFVLLAELDQRDAEQLGAHRIPTQSTMAYAWQKRMTKKTRATIVRSATAIREMAHDLDHPVGEGCDRENGGVKGRMFDESSRDRVQLRDCLGVVWRTVPHLGVATAVKTGPRIRPL